jgi:anti-sigma regulatory factor (Ser/Thr protein kinase)
VAGDDEPGGRRRAEAAFEPSAATVRDARRFVRRVLDEWGYDDAGDASLLVSELATNAVIHARTSYSVTVHDLPGRVRVEVGDSSAATARRAHYSLTSGTGRGLGMVADLAATWGVDERNADVGNGGGGGGGGKVVWFEVELRETPVAPLRRDEVDVEADADALGADVDAILAAFDEGDDAHWGDPSPESGGSGARALLVTFAG